jgi:hypothetical protein
MLRRDEPRFSVLKCPDRDVMARAKIDEVTGKGRNCDLPCFRELALTVSVRGGAKNHQITRLNSFEGKMMKNG